jgi:ABC-2 type transport system permease protein
MLLHSVLVFRRSLRRGMREAPAVFLAPALLAMLIVLLFDGLYGEIGKADEYPGDFIGWVAPAAVLLSVFIGAGLTAATLIEDLRSGYIDRLRLLGITPAALILGRGAFDAVRAVPTAAAVFGVALLVGAENEQGLPGFAGMLVLVAGLAVAWNGIFYLAAVFTLNPASIQGLQPVTFMPAVMFSTFWVPAALMPDWYRWISDHNPATPVIDAGRSMMLGATDWDRVAAAAGVLAVLAAVTYGLAWRRLETRLAAD